MLSFPASLLRSPCRLLRPADLSPSVELTLADLELLADLFYLPFNHGPSALKIMELGHWLREHAFSAPHQSYSHPEVCQHFI
ncbi:unnamed protein product [Dibothriocephalus latus]|uniref:Uncharacterized protein n=1 Tax=Dibothriocephalus latus TaxID=60516 RepID=A0A3P7MED0_DIBLA|nr:unnamed protein product [Dibothriocephalus latus]